MKKILKDKKAITLIALVITIVVLVILAIVTISLTVGNDGLIARAIKAAKGYKDAQERDKQSVNDLYGQLVVAADGTVTMDAGTLREIIQEEIATATEELQNTVTQQGSDIAELKAGVVPAGTIISYSTDTVPTGYLACNGQTVSRTTYAKLFAAIGTRYGAGDGSTTFKVPNLQGEFLRGTGTNSHANQGKGENNAGGHQDATQIPNVIKKPSGAGIQINTLATATNVSDNPQNVDTQKSRVGWICCDTTNYNISSAASSAGAFTTRPTNTSVLYCIKY